jgi:Tfp pilus assembly PilM family ATPase
MLRFGKNITVGLELSGQVLRAACIEHSQDRPKLLALEQQHLPAGTPEALASLGAIGKMIKYGNKARRIVVNIPGCAVHLRKIQVETSETDHLADWVQWEAQQYLPGSPEEYLVEYQKLDAHQTGLLDVLLVAARAEDVRHRARFFHAARLHPAIMDADPLALQNAFETNYPGLHNLPVLLANVEEDIISVVATRAGIPEGVISMETPSEQAQRSDELRRIIDQLKDRIQNVEDSGPSGIKMLLSGGSPQLRELANLFSAQEEIEVEFADPFRELAILPDLRNQLEHRFHASEFMLATGLALRQP